MGYFKNTQSYLQPEFDHKQNNHTGFDNFDRTDCFVCRTVAPDGQVWVDGLCPTCKGMATTVITDLEATR